MLNFMCLYVITVDKFSLSLVVGNVFIDNKVLLTILLINKYYQIKLFNSLGSGYEGNNIIVSK